MGKVFDEIDDKLRAWIERQPLFFVATAPSGAQGHVNVSPKGPIGSLRILGPRTVEYDDYVGSGAETGAHLRENGRICLMFCAFDGPPRIVRLHGRAEAVLNDDPRFGALLAQGGFADASIPEARRSVVLVDVARVSDSCGYGVPLMRLEGHRDHHALSSAKRVRTLGDGYEDAQRTRGARSLDGLPALAD
jgi:pyridoxamine 5'-phosphate oxidase-like protein